MLGLKRGAVALYPHEKAWETEAQATMARLRQILGSVAVEMAHVGSTAIPTIQAKPILDIAVAVDDFNTLLAYEKQLRAAGFYYRPNAQAGVRGQLLFASGSYYDGSGNLQTHFIHIVRTGSVDWQNYILFRDYLRTHSDAAGAYERLKLALAAKLPTDSGREDYVQGKQSFIRSVLRRALSDMLLGKTVDIRIDRPLLSSGFEIFFEKSPKRIVVRKVNQATSASCKAIASFAIRAFTSSSCVCFALSAGIALTTKIVPPILSTKPVFIFSTVITSLCKNRGVRFRTPRYQPKKDYSFS